MVYVVVYSIRERNTLVWDITRLAAARASIAPSLAARETKSIVPENESWVEFTVDDRSDMKSLRGTTGGRESNLPRGFYSL
jgi:hypothetical protein